MTDMACPKCASQDVMTAPMVWESGTASTTSASTGVGIGVVGGRLGLGVGGGHSRGTQVSLLAQRHAPPRHQNYTWAIVLGGVLALIVGAVLGGLIGPALSFMVCLAAWGWLSFRWSREYEAKWTERARQWRRRWICQRCGAAGDEAEFAKMARAPHDMNALAARQA